LQGKEGKIKLKAKVFASLQLQRIESDKGAGTPLNKHFPDYADCYDTYCGS